MFLHIEAFGYEELLHQLALKPLKIKLCSIQQILFEYAGLETMFQYDGEPQIIVWAPFLIESFWAKFLKENGLERRQMKKRAMTQHDYERFVRNNHDVHIFISIFTRDTFFVLFVEIHLNQSFKPHFHLTGCLNKTKSYT